MQLLLTPLRFSASLPHTAVSSPLHTAAAFSCAATFKAIRTEGRVQGRTAVDGRRRALQLDMPHRRARRFLATSRPVYAATVQEAIVAIKEEDGAQNCNFGAVLSLPLLRRLRSTRPPRKYRDDGGLALHVSLHKEVPDVFHALNFSWVRHLAVDRATFGVDMHPHSQVNNICYDIGTCALSITTIECGVCKAATSPLVSSARTPVRLFTASLGCLITGRRLAAFSRRLVGCPQLAAVPVHF